MKLPRPFFQLPVLFDVARLQAEVAALPAVAWVSHPDKLPGNSAARLITADGAETDAVHGQMLPTRWLAAMPYVRQALAGFGVVWSRSRLMRLAAGAGVPEHADINYHWHTRVRLHIPVFTSSEVHFHCDGQSVHMAAGEAWIFDNWRRHHVENNASADRIHLVADTTGTAAFWQFAFGEAGPREQWRTLAWSPGSRPQLLTEGDQRSPVMPAAEVQLLIDDLCEELTPVSDAAEAPAAEAPAAEAPAAEAPAAEAPAAEAPAAEAPAAEAPAAEAPAAEARAGAARFSSLLESFVRDWRQLCALHGVSGQGRPDFVRLAGAVHEAAKPLANGLVMRTNNASALLVLEKRVLQHLVADAPG